LLYITVTMPLAGTARLLLAALALQQPLCGTGGSHLAGAPARRHLQALQRRAHLSADLPQHRSPEPLVHQLARSLKLPPSSHPQPYRPLDEQQEPGARPTSGDATRRQLQAAAAGTEVLSVLNTVPINILLDPAPLHEHCTAEHGCAVSDF
jgi:hypothetical protein